MAKKVIINNLEANGTLDAAAQRKTYGNALFSVNANDGEVVIKDLKVAMNGYNGIEIGLKDAVNPPSKIDIENCDFTGTLTNNGILIFGTADNAVVNIKNCHFAKASNIIRLSNRTNATGVIVNIEDCVIDQWEEDQDNYAGFLILEDYKSASEDEFLEINRFDPEKITINIKNLIYKGKKVMPAKLEECIATFDKDTQLIYMCIDKANYSLPEYTVEIYPTINFE